MGIMIVGMVPSGVEAAGGCEVGAPGPGEEALESVRSWFRTVKSRSTWAVTFFLNCLKGLAE